MKRFERIKPDILLLYDSIKDDFNRRLCRTHHLNVYHQIEKLTDNECLYIAALLHDIGLYLGLREKHALTSAKYAVAFLKPYNCFSDEEIQLIYDVIALHSDKENTHFYEAELLKKADVSAHLSEDATCME